ncbi:MAG: hypothetical protein JW776_04425 [Candidatus Lokiarchaeota archaeon]|nr:hypothetical protein [Candidatus Lokiarchaeota archaeon]
MNENVQTELPEVELPTLILNLKKEKKLMEILRIFLNLIRIRTASFLKSTHHELPSDMHTSDLLSIFSSMLKQEIGITVLESKVEQLIKVEVLFDSPITNAKPTQKLLKANICHIMDLYYQLQDFDPRYLSTEYREKLRENIQRHDRHSPLARNLHYMQPLVRYVTEFQKSNTLRRKLNPFRTATVSIPRSVSPILKEYIESKFNDEAAQIQHENTNITKLIERTLELEEMKKSLMGAFDVSLPILPEAELIRRRSLRFYLLLTGMLMIVLGGIFLSQIILFPQGWKLFLLFGIIPIALFGFCMYLVTRLSEV